LAASTGITGTTGTFLCEAASGFLGKGMLPKSQKWHTLMATLPRKTEPVMLNSRQRYDSTLAIVPGKAQMLALCQPFSLPILLMQKR
jgi:hypothetical protein